MLTLVLLPIFKFIVHARDITIAQQHGSDAIIALEPVQRVQLPALVLIHRAG